MDFLKKLFVNIIYILVILLILYLIFPDFMGGIFQAYGIILGPGLLILLLLNAALPRKR